jgi:peroxiredoxin
MKISVLSSAVLLSALVFTGCGPKKDKDAPKPNVGLTAALPTMGVAPAWKLQDVNGNVVTSDQFKGKVVVLDFWATWCGPCKMEIPGYTDLQRKYGKDDLVIVGLSVDDGTGAAGKVKEFASKFGINYQMLMADEAVQSAFGGVEAIPTTFLIDRNGQIRNRKVGVEPTAEYEKKILAVLKGA